MYPYISFLTTELFDTGNLQSHRGLIYIHIHHLYYSIDKARPYCLFFVINDCTREENARRYQKIRIGLMRSLSSESVDVFYLYIKIAVFSAEEVIQFNTTNSNVPAMHVKHLRNGYVHVTVAIQVNNSLAGMGIHMEDLIDLYPCRIYRPLTSNYLPCEYICPTYYCIHEYLVCK